MRNRWYFNEVHVLGTLVGTVTPHQSRFGNVATFSILVKEYKMVDGKYQSKPEFIPITAFGKLADVALKLLPKAKYIIVGKISTSKYVKAGQTISRTTVIAEEIIEIDRLPAIREVYKKTTAITVDPEMVGDVEDNPYDILDELVLGGDDTEKKE